MITHALALAGRSTLAGATAAVSARTVLQLGDLSTVQLLFGLGEVVAIALGLTISYVAYRGYRNHDARPMLFVSLGFVLLVGVGTVAGVAFLTLPGVSEVGAGAVTQVAEILGMASILYGLRMDPD